MVDAGRVDVRKELVSLSNSSSNLDYSGPQVRVTTSKDRKRQLSLVGPSH
jgi:hypothetical protein